MSSDREGELRRKIVEINNNTTLTNREKNSLIQNLMSELNNANKENSSIGTSDTVNGDSSRNTSMLLQTPDNANIQPTFRDDKKTILGCKHYSRQNQILSHCCNKWYTCRLCHNEANNHEIDRTKITTMICMLCSQIQQSSQTCVNCQATMSTYYCDICHLWDSAEDSPIYHCNDCGICRRGEGLDKDNFHCKKCNICMNITMKDNHKCIERNLESDCPICGEYLFTSVNTVVFMDCGHSIHQECYHSLIQNSYKCPICLKSLGDMSHYFKRIDRHLKNQKLPPEYKGYQSKVFCNDCQERCVTKFHFLYHKCKGCGSYNTNVLDTIVGNPDDLTSEDEDEEVNEDDITSEDDISSEDADDEELGSDQNNQRSPNDNANTGAEPSQQNNNNSTQSQTTSTIPPLLEQLMQTRDEVALQSLAQLIENNHPDINTRDAMMAIRQILEDPSNGGEGESYEFYSDNSNSSYGSEDLAMGSDNINWGDNGDSNEHNNGNNTH